MIACIEYVHAAGPGNQPTTGAVGALLGLPLASVNPLVIDRVHSKIGGFSRTRGRNLSGSFRAPRSNRVSYGEKLMILAFDFRKTPNRFASFGLILSMCSIDSQ